MSAEASLFHVFSSDSATGNSAAVQLLQRPCDLTTMQDTARRLGASATAFLYPHGRGYQVQWFSPESQITLCGHGALAATHFLLRDAASQSGVTLYTPSLSLEAEKQKDGSYSLSLPKKETQPFLGPRPLAYEDVLWRATDHGVLIGIYPSRQAIAAFILPVEDCRSQGIQHLAITAADSDTRYVLRYFNIDAARPEDPATGSAQTYLAPYWAETLSQDSFTIEQLSPDGGYLRCQVKEHTVTINGFVT